MMKYIAGSCLIVCILMLFCGCSTDMQSPSGGNYVELLPMGRASEDDKEKVFNVLHDVADKYGMKRNTEEENIRFPTYPYPGVVDEVMDKRIYSMDTRLLLTPIEVDLRAAYYESKLLEVSVGDSFNSPIAQKIGKEVVERLSETFGKARVRVDQSYHNFYF